MNYSRKNSNTPDLSSRNYTYITTYTKQLFNRAVYLKEQCHLCYLFLLFTKLQTQQVSQLVQITSLRFLNITMSIPKKREYHCKKQAFVAASISLRSRSPSRDKEALGFSAPNLPTGPSNSNPSLTTSQTSQYSKNNLQQISKTVLEAQLSPICNQDQRIIEDRFQQALKPKTPDIYKGKLHIDYQNFIQLYKDYFVRFRFWAATKFFLPPHFSKKNFGLVAII